MRRLLDADDLARMLRRLAHEIVEGAGGAHDLVLLGIPSRGVPLAERLAAAIGGIEGATPPVGTLDVTLYRDAIARR